MHELEIKDGDIYLDGFKVKDIQEFELKSSANDYTELSVRIHVKLTENKIELKKK